VEEVGPGAQRCIHFNHHAAQVDVKFGESTTFHLHVVLLRVVQPDDHLLVLFLPVLLCVVHHVATDRHAVQRQVVQHRDFHSHVILAVHHYVAINQRVVLHHLPSQGLVARSRVARHVPQHVLQSHAALLNVALLPAVQSPAALQNVVQSPAVHSHVVLLPVAPQNVRSHAVPQDVVLHLAVQSHALLLSAAVSHVVLSRAVLHMDVQPFPVHLHVARHLVAQNLSLQKSTVQDFAVHLHVALHLVDHHVAALHLVVHRSVVALHLVVHRSVALHLVVHLCAVLRLYVLSERVVAHHRRHRLGVCAHAHHRHAAHQNALLPRFPRDLELYWMAAQTSSAQISRSRKYLAAVAP